MFRSTPVSICRIFDRVMNTHSQIEFRNGFVFVHPLLNIERLHGHDGSCRLGAVSLDVLTLKYMRSIDVVKLEKLGI